MTGPDERYVITAQGVPAHTVESRLYPLGATDASLQDFAELNIGFVHIHINQTPAGVALMRAIASEASALARWAARAPQSPVPPSPIPHSVNATFAADPEAHLGGSQ